MITVYILFGALQAGSSIRVLMPEVYNSPFECQKHLDGIVQKPGDRLECRAYEIKVKQ